MSKPREIWWDYAKKMIRQYPDLKKEYDGLHEQKITADLSGMPRGAGAGRTVEQTALRQLPPDKQIEYDAVTGAIAETLAKTNGVGRMALIDLVFWKGHQIAWAARRLYISEKTAKNYHREFIHLVGKKRGLK